MIFTYSGKNEGFYSMISRFRRDSLLKKINKETATLLLQDNTYDINGLKKVSLSLLEMRSGSIVTQNVIVSAWMLLELAYYTILHTNDVQGNENVKDEELYALVAVCTAVCETIEKEKLVSFRGNHNDVMFFVWGFWGEQKKMEAPGNVFDNCTRELYILFESSKKSPRTVDVAGIVKHQTGAKWEDVVKALLYAWCASIISESITEFEEELDWSGCSLCRELFENIIQTYTMTDEDIEKPSFNRQKLYSKPFIRTQYNEIIPVNSYLVLYAYEHCIYWIIRNYYSEREDQYFTSVFGDYFEAYFRELLEKYLQSKEFQKIPEENTKRADWKLEIDGFSFLIEQKATLMGLFGKQQLSDIEMTKRFAVNAVIKAIRQLHNTEIALGDKKYIKIILIYEDYLQSSVLDNVFLMDECDVENDNYYWMVTISEMEKLLALCETQRDLFDKVIAEKIKRETNHSNNTFPICRTI